LYGTGTRIDRAHELARQLEAAEALSAPEAGRHRELAATEQRTLLLLAALRSFYIALGSFASAALVWLLGAVFVPMGAGDLVQVLEVVGVVAGLAVSTLVHGSVMPPSSGALQTRRPARAWGGAAGPARAGGADGAA
jgi:hypothetical protein